MNVSDEVIAEQPGRFVVAAGHSAVGGQELIVQSLRLSIAQQAEDDGAPLERHGAHPEGGGGRVQPMMQLCVPPLLPLSLDHVSWHEQCSREVLSQAFYAIAFSWENLPRFDPVRGHCLPRQQMKQLMGEVEAASPDGFVAVDEDRVEPREAKSRT